MSANSQVTMNEITSNDMFKWNSRMVPSARFDVAYRVHAGKTTFHVVQGGKESQAFDTHQAAYLAAREMQQNAVRYAVYSEVLFLFSFGDPTFEQFQAVFYKLTESGSMTIPEILLCVFQELKPEEYKHVPVLARFLIQGHQLTLMTTRNRIHTIRAAVRGHWMTYTMDCVTGAQTLKVQKV